MRPPWSSLVRSASQSRGALALVSLLTRAAPKNPHLALRLPASTRCLHLNSPPFTNHATWRELSGDKSHHGTYPSRTHNCGELRSHHDGQEVVLCGWAQFIRHISSDLVFIHVRDAFGVTQLVFSGDPSTANGAAVKTVIENLTVESVICAVGAVRKRLPKTIKKTLPTGEIEVELKSLYLLNPADQLPFVLSHDELPSEETRLKYRYLDLRRPFLQNNLRVRSLTASTIRNFLIDKGFVEVETPILFKSTPEGACEYIVPTRTPGAFYALPQSPQQHKQLLMSAGMDRYFQIARCFRDEGLRADRQPEFTQVDLEMSFVTARDIQDLIEGMVATIWHRVLGIELGKDAFPRMTYQDAMSRFGSDKPDTRFAMEINDISPHLPDITTDSALDCLVVKGGAALAKLEIKSLEEAMGMQNVKDIAIVKISDANRDGTWLAETSLTKQSVHVDETREALSRGMKVEVGDLIVINKRPKFFGVSEGVGNEGGSTPLGRTRLKAASLLQSKGFMVIDPALHNFLWVESFPLFSPEDPTTGRAWVSTHHPFTAPVAEDVELLVAKPEEVCSRPTLRPSPQWCRDRWRVDPHPFARAADLDSGERAQGGSHGRVSLFFHAQFGIKTLTTPTLLGTTTQFTKEEYSLFNHLINALRCGCPPHGGIALGFDRLMSIICRTPSIRDVIAFPKSSAGKDFVVDSPSNVTEKKLREYGLQLVECQKE
ncbi:tRNA synthetases class II-domain-containing protein [Jimgerdemannia flammicorona]|uniref:tRNA synthetases class II-domain-containing protein n=1 Tax=Jimgerdemannia flammicorona TaxID=994334 RepID=A0A433DL70_9FUNG|nr:tRNA synthetases class II-domain-containing protein [Jimgerdemannia flammicorona]